MNPYHHLQPLERKYIRDWHQAKISLSEIARTLGRAKSTISREIRRNSDSRGRYQQIPAHQMALARRSRSRTKYRGVLAEFIVQELEKDLSPDQIVMDHRDLSISTHGIYNFIWRDYRDRGALWKNLRSCGKGAHMRSYCQGPGKARITRNRNNSISRRPGSIGDRLHFGHWEMDLIEAKGRRRPLVVLIERKSRYVLAGFLKGKWSSEVARVASRLLNNLKVLSITTDNGPKFLDTKLIQAALCCKLYYTHSYSSWQKGAVENVNKLLRQYFPKGTFFSSCSQQLPRLSCSKINQRPRRSLNSKSPQKLFKHIVLNN